jgi:hypothetical protein
MQPQQQQQPTVIVVKEAATCPEEGLSFLKVRSAPPFATVQANGKTIGETPIDGYVQLPAGKIHLEVIHRLYKPIDTLIYLSPTERKEIHLVFPPESGSFPGL